MMHFILLVFFVVTAIVAQAQSVVVSEYMCQSGGLDFVEKEWTELLVVDDNVDLTNYIVSDYGVSMTVPSSGPQFLDVPLWRNLRAGTIILIWHGAVNQVLNLDTNASDGFLELSQMDLRFFRVTSLGGGFATGMNIAQDLDYVEILGPDSLHVHGLAHCRPTSTGYTSSAMPKVAYDTNFIGDAASVRVTGRTLAAYAARLGKDSVSRGRDLGVPTEAPSPGLPNLIDNLHRQRGFKNVNQFFWREVREPEWTTTPIVTLVEQQASKHVISWTPLVDPQTSDGLTGYIVVRDTLGFTQFPAGILRDGAVVNVGQRIGSALVVANVKTKTGATYTDQSNLICGITYTYRVYGYRFDADQAMPESATFDSTARGRQYNEVFAQSAPVTKPNPTRPIISASRTLICPGDTTTLSTTTTDAELYEWSVDGRPVPVGGTTRIVVHEAGTYKLRITARGGCFAESNTITVTFLPAQSVDVSPSGDQSLCAGDTIVITSSITGSSYEWLRDGIPIPGATAPSYAANVPGDYQVRIAVQQGCPGISSIVRIRPLDVRYHFEPASIDFGVLGECETSTSKVIELVNDGKEAVTVGSVATPPGFALAFPPPGFVVAPGSRQSVRMLFAPATNGVSSGNAIFTAQPCNNTEPVALRGERVGGSASLSKAGVDFGVYTACSGTVIKPDSIFAITNNGTSPISVRAPLVSPPFYLITQFIVVVLQPGEQKEIRVQYRPLGADLNRGVSQEIAFPFTSTTCSDTLRASLQAASYQPALTTSFTSFNIGSVLSCYGSADTVIDVTNPSPIAATLTGSVSGSIQLPDAPIDIPPSSTRSVRIRVTPGGAGVFTITDTLLSEPCRVSLPLTVRGTIIDPTYTATPSTTIVDPVDFCSGDSISTGVFTLTAIGSGGLRSTIAGIDVNAPFSTSLSPGQTLFDSIQVTVTYSPTSVSFDTDTIVIILAPCLDTVKCIVQGVAQNSSRTTTITSTDFGTIAPLQTSSRVITITNTGTTDIVVEALEGIIAPFRVETSVPVLPATLAPAEKAVVRVAYDFIGHDRHDTIDVQSRTTSPCTDTVQFTLTAATTPSDTTLTAVTVVIPTTVSARIGDVALIPFALLAPSSIAPDNVRSMDVYLHYDPSILAPLSIEGLVGTVAGAVTETRPGYAHIVVTSQSAIDASDPLFMLRAKTYMGASRTTLLEIDSIVMDGIDAEARDGQLTLTGDCAIETQIIALGQMPAMRIESNNGSSVSIGFTTLTDELTTITLCNVLGAVLRSERVLVRPGTHILHLSTSDFPAGLYYATMSHGRYVRSNPLLIVR